MAKCFNIKLLLKVQCKFECITNSVLIMAAVLIFPPVNKFLRPKRSFTFLISQWLNLWCPFCMYLFFPRHGYVIVPSLTTLWLCCFSCRYPLQHSA